MKSFPDNDKVRIKKFKHQFLPTAAIQAVVYQSKTCICCGTREETHWQILRCAHPARIVILTKYRQTMTEHLKNTIVHTILRHEIQAYGTHFFDHHVDDPLIPQHSDCHNTSRFHQEVASIGWNQLWCAEFRNAGLHCRPTHTTPF